MGAGVFSVCVCVCVFVHVCNNLFCDWTDHFIFHFRHILFLEGAGVKTTVKVSGTKVCPV